MKGALVGGELEGGGSALIGFSRTAEQLSVNVSMVSGPAGTLGRLLRKNSFTQEIKAGKMTDKWVKVIKLKKPGEE